MIDVVAVVVFSDDGHAYIMGASKHKAVECVIKGVKGKQYHYVQDNAQRLQFLERTIAVMDGED